ncbi:MAG: SIS domain-containing protein [Clostridiales bacterium]|nr:SIS domain-containing protein [Clostridiales bacterium]
MSDCLAFYGIDKDFFAEKGCENTSAEIAQQPRVWRELGDMLLGRKNDIAAFLEKTNGDSQLRVVLTGAGSSGFVGDAVAALAAKSAGVRAESVHTTDIVSDPRAHLFPDAPTLLVSFARSGNSPESAGAVKYARSIVKNLFEIAIVCDGTSNLYNMTAQSDKSMVLLMPEDSNDKGFAMTSSVSSMLLAGFALFNAGNIGGIVSDIASLSQNVAGSSLKFTAAASKWAEKDFDRIVYIGSGFLKHVAHEASLKMMELTNGIVNGAFESATGFRHGPKTVINDKTLTVHMISNDLFTAQYDMDLLNEVCKEKKQNVAISIGAEPAGGIPCDEAVAVPAEGYGVCADVCTGLQSLVFCQMLAMFKSMALGVGADNPSPTGEVNRVVKGVTIYDF